jgi:hypothetical protein
MKLIAYDRLIEDLKAQALTCKESKLAHKEAQRTVSRVTNASKLSWADYMKLCRPVDTTRAAAAAASEAMTKLCVFRAHLRGRKHLTPNSCWADQVEGWINNLEERYTIEVSDTRAAG